ncbi:MAG: type II secretion system F family protein, partial [Planctomycetota bacterium]|nr:type II secretion system F family protein [Planctomycetota bacterium]
MFDIIVVSVLIIYVILGYKKPGIALVTMPPVVILLFYVSSQMGPEEISIVTVLGPVLFFGTLIAVLLSKREVDSEQWPRKCAKWVLRACVALLLFATVGVVSGPLGVIGLGFFILFIGAGLTSRRMIAAYIISTIGSSIRQNLPLSMALEAAVSGQVDKRAKILRKIQKWLVQGYPLSEAIKRGYPRCPGYAVAMIAAAERINQLPFAIKSIEADMLARTDESRKLRPMHPVYPVILITFMFFIVWALMVYIIPQFNTVLTEMTEGARLPAATRLLCGIANFIAYGPGWQIGLEFVVIILVIIPVSIYVKFRPRRPDKPHLLSRIGDFIRWHLPVLHWFANNYSMVQVVELLRLSLNAGCTVNDAIAETLTLDVNNCFRKRLQQWLIKVQRGENVAAAARESKLGSTIAWAFDDKVNQGNTLAILETLESSY